MWQAPMIQMQAKMLNGMTSEACLHNSRSIMQMHSSTISLGQELMINLSNHVPIRHDVEGGNMSTTHMSRP